MRQINLIFLYLTIIFVTSCASTSKQVPTPTNTMDLDVFSSSVDQLLKNKDFLLKQINKFEDQMDILKAAIKDKDIEKIQELMKSATPFAHPLNIDPPPCFSQHKPHANPIYAVRSQPLP